MDHSQFPNVDSKANEESDVHETLDSFFEQRSFPRVVPECRWMGLGGFNVGSCDGAGEFGAGVS